MSYNTEIKTMNGIGNLKEAFEKMSPSYKTDRNMESIQSLGGSKRYGTGGRWETDNMYIAINGHASRGGLPLKLQCADGDLPISPTDTENLRRAGVIQ